MSKAHERIHFATSIAHAKPVCEEKPAGVMRTVVLWKHVTCKNCRAERKALAATKEKGTT